MKLEIYTEKTPQEEPVRLALREHGGSIAVVAVDRNGQRIERGTLLSFTAGGEIDLHPVVSEEFGFRLDGTGRIITNR